MGIMAPVKLTLNHFATDLHRPNLTQIEALEGNIRSLKVKAFAYSALEKICYVALLAIMATIFAVSYSTITLTGSLPLLIAVMALSTPLIAFGVSKFTKLAHEYTTYSENESAVLLQLKKIEQWKAPEINQFLLAERLISNGIPLEALRQLNPDEPLRGLLPLIARFNQMKIASQEKEAERNKARPELEEAFRKKEAETGKQIDPQEKQTIRYVAQNTAWRQHEQGSVPLALQAATMLELIQNPTQKDMDVDPFSFEIAGIGKCVPKSFSERIFGRNDEQRNDDYFIFHPALHRPPLELQTIENNFEPRDLRLVLFPQAIRV